MNIDIGYIINTSNPHKDKLECVKQKSRIKKWYLGNKSSILKAAAITYLALELTTLSFIGGYKLGKHFTKNSEMKKFIQVEIGNEQFYIQK